jgi:hypothetical protein
MRPKVAANAAGFDLGASSAGVCQCHGHDTSFGLVPTLKGSHLTSDA